MLPCSVLIVLAVFHWSAAVPIFPRPNDEENIGQHKRNVDLTEYIKFIVDKHNLARRELWIERNANNLRRLSWSKELAMDAKYQSSKCDVTYRDDVKRKNGYNYDSIPNHQSFSTGMLDNILDKWISESHLDIFTECSTGIATDCNRYTQVIWAETRHIGCALQSCGTLISDKSSKYDVYYFVCMYKKRGNINGRPPAKLVDHGFKQCAGCDAAERCDNGLCYYDESCKNIDGDDTCDDYAKRGFCKMQEDTKRKCKRSCNNCEVGLTCEDEDTGKHCQEQKKAGACEVNRKWMENHCRKTCGFCPIA